MVEIVCRTCLQIVEDTQFLFIDSTDEPRNQTDIKAKLQMCVPELRLDRVKNSIMCNACVLALNTAFNFKTKCVEIETKIARYMSDVPTKSIEMDIATKTTIDSITVDHNVSIFLPSQNSIRCLVCQKWFNTVEVFKQHMNTHVAEHSCTKCSFKANSQTQLTRHYKTHNLTSPIKLFQCPKCDFRTTDKSAFVNHRASHTNSKDFSCELCDFTTALGSKYRRHLKTHAGKEIRCDKCTFTTSSALSYQMHLKTHSTPALLKCDHCPYTTVKPTNLKTHMWRNHRNKKRKTGFHLTMEDVAFILDHGNMEEIFQDEEPLNSDTLLVTTEDVVEALKFTEVKSYFKRQGERTFSCPVCDKSFKAKTMLNKHVLEHGDDAIYKCNQCEFTDNKMANYRLHMTSHTGGKVYSCEQCDYRTLYYKTFQNHLRMHQRQVVMNCPVCEFTTSNKDEMERHTMTHPQLMPAAFRCGECLFETDLEDEIRMHLDMHALSKEFIDSSIHQHFLPQI